MNQMTPIIYFEFPIASLFVVGIVRVLAYKFFRIFDDSVISWQIIGLLSLIAFIIYGQTRILILNSFYDYSWEHTIYYSEVITALIAISFFNFLYSIIKPIFTKTLKLR